MGRHTFPTTLVLRVGDAEAEYAATVTYFRHKAFNGGRDEPSSDAHCEVEGITLDFTPTRRIALDDLIVAELQDGLQPELMEQWDADIADAEECRAEQRRDDRLMGLDA
jgi:hypothetical protein